MKAKAQPGEEFTSKGFYKIIGRSRINAPNNPQSRVIYALNVCLHMYVILVLFYRNKVHGV